MKRIAPRTPGQPAATGRNAGLLTPTNFVPDTGVGTVTYRQPWDRLRGIRSGHDRESMVAAVTTAIARDVADTSRFITRAELLGTGRDYTDESDYAYALNVAASQQMTASAFWQHATLNLLYVGECYILESGKTLTPLVGGTVEIAPGAKSATNADGSPQLISGYIVRNDAGEVVGTYASDGSAIGRGAIPGSILHRAYMPHPENVLRANAPLEQAGLPIDVLHYFRQATKSVLLNDGMVAGVLSVEDPTVDEDGIRQLERRANSRMADPQRKGRMLVVDAHTKYTPLGNSPLGRDWVEMADHFRREVLAVFRAPESVLGSVGGMTYENQHVANRSYIQQVVMPLRQLILDSLNVRARRIGHLLYLDTEAIPELAEDEALVAERVSKLYLAGIITVNEAREMVGLSELAGGDERAQARPATAAPVPQPEADQEGRGAPLAERAEARATQPNPGRWVSALDAATDAAGAVLAEYAQTYHARLYRNLSGAVKRLTAEHRDVPVGPIDADALFNLLKRNGELSEDLLPLLTAEASRVLRVGAQQLALPMPDLDGPEWRTLLDARVSRLVEGTTVDGVTVYRGWNQQIHADLVEALATAYRNGESVDGAIGRVANLLGVDPANPKAVGHRAERIARTETIGLSNEVAKQQMAASGVVTEKEWYSIADNRSRDSHIQLNGTRIPFAAEFNVNGYLADGPHDLRLPAEEVINCRCRLIPVVG
jgi:HK97 family phage portal protein